jgi:hypothetical protein
MRPCPSPRFLLLMLLAAGGGSLAWAQAPIDAGGIAGAKQEFQALQRAESAPNSARVELPRINVPQLSDTAPDAPTPLSREKTLAAQKEISRQSKNWLVDAMMKGGHGRRDAVARSHADSRSDADGIAEAAAASGPFAQLTDEQTVPSRSALEPTRQSGRGELPDEPGPDPLANVSNPLSAYMAGWISAPDRALLLPKPDEIRAGPDGLQPDAAAIQGPRNLNDGPPAGLDAFKSTAANPYLPISDTGPLNLPPAASLLPPPAPPELAAPAPLPPAAAPTPPPSRPPANAPPDFAKPDDDAKYFPQLKRF